MSKIIILGAGSTGLAAGYELAQNGHQVFIIEKENKVGGLARTEEYQGNLFDIGPHRFFTKNKEVQKFWEDMLGQDLLKRPRLTRIYYQKKYFYYPLKLGNALKNLGFLESAQIFMSLIKVRFLRLVKKSQDKSFEDWVVNRFGRRLFNHFFKSYTEKLWGVSTSEIGAEWAGQRLQSMSLLKIIKSFIFKPQAGSVKSWVEEFYYPRLGAGQMSETIAKFITNHGGQILLNSNIQKIIADDGQLVTKVIYKNIAGEESELAGDYFINTLPITMLINIWGDSAASRVLPAIKNLSFRATIFVNLIIEKDKAFLDNWLYIHEPQVRVLRITNAASFSEEMVKPGKTVLTMEYVCNIEEEFWHKSEEELLTLAQAELRKIGIIDHATIFGGKVIKVANTYPVYGFGYREDMAQIFSYLSAFKNFQTAGRSGLYRYNNMDHSILTGFYAARNIMGGHYNVLDVNADDDYHEG